MKNEGVGWFAFHCRVIPSRFRPPASQPAAVFKEEFDLKRTEIPQTFQACSCLNQFMRDANNNNNTTTGLQTAIALLKGNIGPGCLALPWAFSLLGIPLGCIITVIMTSMVTWNAWTLVALKRQIWDINKRGVTYSVCMLVPTNCRIFRFTPFMKRVWHTCLHHVTCDVLTL